MNQCSVCYFSLTDHDSGICRKCRSPDAKVKIQAICTVCLWVGMQPIDAVVRNPDLSYKRDAAGLPVVDSRCIRCGTCKKRVSSFGISLLVNGRWIMKHRLIMQGILGRSLLRSEDVRFRDGDVENLNHDNLYVVHRALRKEGKRYPRNL